MKIRSDFVSNSSSSSFVFVVKSYNDVQVSDQAIGFEELIAQRTCNWLDENAANSCKLVNDVEFLAGWWINDNYPYEEDDFFGLTHGTLKMLPVSLCDDLLKLGCFKDNDSLFWNGLDSNKQTVIDMMKEFIIKHGQSRWCLCEFEASSWTGETEVHEDDGWDYVPENSVWSKSINNH